MKTPRPIDPARRDWLSKACDLVGGSRELARRLKISEPAMSKYLTTGPNARGIPDGIISDTRAVLRVHALDCQTLADALVTEA